MEPEEQGIGMSSDRKKANHRRALTCHHPPRLPCHALQILGHSAFSDRAGAIIASLQTKCSVQNVHLLLLLLLQGHCHIVPWFPAKAGAVNVMLLDKLEEATAATSQLNHCPTHMEGTNSCNRPM